MKHILLITILQSAIANIEIRRREVCLSCDILQQCEQVVCNNVLINGTFIPDYVIGCELACLFGNISCQKDNNGTLTWLPEDPCLPLISTTTSEPNNSLATTTYFPFHADTPQINTTTDLGVLNTTIIEINETDSDYVSTESPSYTTEDINYLKGWTLFWLIPLVLIITIPILLLFCLVLNHFQRRKHRVEFPLSEKHIFDIIDPSTSSWGNFSHPYKTGTPIGQNGYYRQNRNTIFEAYDSPNKTDRILTNLHKISSPIYTKLKFTNRKSISPCPNRRLINWQESGTYEFAIPPSPKSASSMNISKTPPNYSPKKERNYSRIPYNLNNSTSQIFSGSPTIHIRYPEEMRSISQYNILNPQKSNVQDILLPDYYIQDGRTTTTFNRHDNHLQRPKLSDDDNQIYQTEALINCDDNEFNNEDTFDQISSITMQPTTIQQPISNVSFNQPFNAFIDCESQQQIDQLDMYHSQYNDWTLDKTTIPRIPRI
ncbi:unnamed protein product [Schistosoma rodhaini]|uniref:TIL domain-containing protein n=1 Tax=Schistosoma rodhaini TaxID=6188 RepID=A0AA85FYE7_9TREM|nr:unnamed protein product [Schistosoma rodhaini]CAH8599836.1 unnamed protein product [Schistosoma rodhaini]